MSKERTESTKRLTLFLNCVIVWMSNRKADKKEVLIC